MNTVKNKDEIVSLITHNSDELKQLGLLKLGIFGSFARNEQKEDSDIDLLAEIKPGNKNIKSLFRIIDYLENLFGRKVDLVTPQGLNKYIGPKILQTVEYVSFSA